jgi:anti-anti-sigma factor
VTKIRWQSRAFEAYTPPDYWDLESPVALAGREVQQRLRQRFTKRCYFAQCGPWFSFSERVDSSGVSGVIGQGLNALQGASMKTAVGVFSNLDRAEQAIRALLKNRVPAERITFLTRSEPEANSIGQRLYSESGLRDVGASARFSVISVSGIGPVLVQGPDVSDIFDQPQRDYSSTYRAPASNEPWRRTPVSHGSDDDAAFFRRMLSEGCSVIVVRTDSNQIAVAACEVLDKLSLGIGKTPAGKGHVSVRKVPGAAIATFSGKLALDDGCLLLRETVRALLDGGQRRILLDLERLDFLDSAGLGELVRTHVAVRSRGAQLTLINPSSNVRQLLRITKVDQTFDIAPDELTALNKAR